MREGDGEAMMSVWRLNMLEFWDNNHPRYLKIGHRLLAGKKQYKLMSNALHYMEVSKFVKDLENNSQYLNYRCIGMASTQTGQGHHPQPDS